MSSRVRGCGNERFIEVYTIRLRCFRKLIRSGDYLYEPRSAYRVIPTENRSGAGRRVLSLEEITRFGKTRGRKCGGHAKNQRYAQLSLSRDDTGLCHSRRTRDRRGFG